MTNKTKDFCCFIYLLFITFFFFYFEFASLFVSMSLCIGLLFDVNVLAPCVQFLSVLCIKHMERKYHLMDPKNWWSKGRLWTKTCYTESDISEGFVHCFDVIMQQSSGLKPLKLRFQCLSCLMYPLLKCKATFCSSFFCQIFFHTISFLMYTCETTTLTEVQLAL